MLASLLLLYCFLLIPFRVCCVQQVDSEDPEEQVQQADASEEEEPTAPESVDHRIEDRDASSSLPPVEDGHLEVPDAREAAEATGNIEEETRSSTATDVDAAGQTSIETISDASGSVMVPAAEEEMEEVQWEELEWEDEDSSIEDSSTSSTARQDTATDSREFRCSHDLIIEIVEKVADADAMDRFTALSPKSVLGSLLRPWRQWASTWKAIWKETLRRLVALSSRPWTFAAQAFRAWQARR